MDTGNTPDGRVHSIIGAFFAVYNYYGFGLSERVYSGALERELADRGHHVIRELTVEVSYKGRTVAWHRLDMVVDRMVIIENKAGEALPKFARQQLLSYLRTTDFKLGLLFHFGPEPRFYRYNNDPRKPSIQLA